MSGLHNVSIRHTSSDLSSNRPTEIEQITAADARAAARDWIATEVSRMPGYIAAFIAGSTAALPASDALPPWSDTDVMVVLEGDAPQKVGKFRRDRVLLEGTWLARGEIGTPETVLASYHAAHAVGTGVELDDPSGWLTDLQRAVRADFPRRSRVAARVLSARLAVTRGLEAMRDTGSIAEQAQSWVFPTGIATHVLLVAGLRNPTVRRRYETVRDLLEAHGRLDLHEHLLEALGSLAWTPDVARRHLEAITALYDAAAPISAPDYRFGSDITPLTRPISIDGTSDMIARGFHREAAFWLVVTGSRALQKMALGGEPGTAARFEPAYAELLADLGAATHKDRAARRRLSLALLPEIDAAASAITDATPGVIRD
jgi:hypothetical protein